MACYSGDNPVKTDEERMAIWRWAKANGIDHGLPFDKVHDAINTQFFGGMAKPEWINDILSGRKTPFRAQADEAWKAQYNRRMVTQQAQEQLRSQTANPIAKGLQWLWERPRAAAVYGHGVVFPVTHGGDLMLRPQSWGIFFRGLINTWTKSWSKAASERAFDTMKRQPLYETALRSGLDVGERSHAGNLVLASAKGTPSERAWSMLKTMRFELWNRQMQKLIKPGMNQEEVLDIGRNMAEWANHATGSAKGPISNLGGKVLFGPKLTQSKLNRLITDPVKTVQTFVNWKTATAGEKAVAMTRLSGTMQYLSTGLGMLAVNQGVLMATGSKQNINFTDPKKSDWLAFKAGDLEWSIPGMHSELRTLGQILAVPYMDKKALHGESKQARIGDIMGQYVMGKATPTIGLAKEILTGQDFRGRPLPWSAEHGTPKKPKYSWDEYLLSRGPIPLTGPARYVYDQLRQNGASGLDAIGIIKALIIGAVGASGIHISPDYSAEPKPTLRQAIRRGRAAAALQNR